MVPTNSLAVFLRHNDKELRKTTSYICSTLHYKEPVEDVVQDIYLKLCTLNILQNYNRHYKTNKPGSLGNTRLSSLLFLVVRNHVLGKMKSSAYKSIAAKCDYDVDSTSGDESEFDMVLRYNDAAEEYRDIQEYNSPSDDPDGLGLEFEVFKKNFKESFDNKKVFSRKRKDHPDRISCTLMDIFVMLYQGYTNKDIADFYGVTSMSIINMRRKLAEAMQKYGINSLLAA